MIETLPVEYQQRVERCVHALADFERDGSLPSHVVRDAVVVDWEAGDLAFSVALLSRGAKFVYAFDKWLQPDAIPVELRRLPNLVVQKCDIAQFLLHREADVLRNDTINLIFANTVTEHMQSLAQDFHIAYRLLERGGRLFVNHDNYYQPVGSHDHGFLFYGPESEIVFQGTACWTTAQKCDSSASHRADIARRYPWTWNAELDGARDPSNCPACPYFKRSQAWAHLLYSSEFDTLFPTPAFKTGVEGASLNKLTIFQLKQLLIENSFVIVTERRSHVSNTPPAELLSGEMSFTREDLTTATIRILAERK